MVKLGKLKEVDIRKVWAHEQYDFSKWLSSEENIKELGDNIVVQGGTFRNHSIVRALELQTGCNVSFTDVPELMGAYGAALHVMNKD